MKKTKVLFKRQNRPSLIRAAREVRVYPVNMIGNRVDIVHRDEYELEAFTEVYEDLTGESLIIKAI